MSQQIQRAFLAALLCASSAAQAGVSAAEAARLGKDLTEVGAERAGNKDGTIPAWVGAPSFSPEMLKIKRKDLEDLRVRLVKDIQQMLTDPAVTRDMLANAQAIMDAEPAKADRVLQLVREMLSADSDLKAEFNKSLNARGGKSVDGLLDQVQQHRIKLPQLTDDIVAAVQEVKAKGGDFLARLTDAFGVERMLQIVALIDNPQTRVQANALVMKYMPSYVRGFLDYHTPGKQTTVLDSIKPLYVVTNANLAQYKSQISVGHLAMFATYPDYKMIVYPTARNAFYPDEILKATIANATRATLVGTDDVQNAQLGFPFPIPKSGAEPLWNHKLKFRGSAVKRFNNQAIVAADGSYKISKLIEDVKFKYASLKEPATTGQRKIFALYLQEVLSPPRVAGQIILVHETAGGAGNSRAAWIFSPGLGRVNRAPDVGYDNPSVGSDGEQFNDQVDVFNGALDRYDWKLLGKKEVLIPYNSWLLNSPTFKYKDIIRAGHINQDLARYELHRVWVVEATLRQGTRHRFGKRRFYIDEDSWAIASVDCYDDRGELWKVQEAHLITVPFIPTTTGIPEIIYDLQSKRYFITALTNEDAISDFETSYTDDFFSPGTLQRKARNK
ncbi:MAG TPA: DUF1329 domain-containing protein [Nevskiaceae bacterium]|nr:DUF1329 domain-containing protein [Nevskiaceae bacterium]